VPAFPRAHLAANKVKLIPLVGATYFMVSGGPYGLEEVAGHAGYALALTLILALALIWALPVALMVGELASAMPAEGGFYIWVTRAFGPFWGFQTSWLSLAASVFDMAIYPTLFSLYFDQLAPGYLSGHRALAGSFAIVLICVLWNLRGARDVGAASKWMMFLLLIPFIILTIAALIHATHSPSQHWGRAQHSGLHIAVLVAMWNLMGWDNASTIAREVDNPRRTYLRAMLLSVAIVALSYIVPITAIALAGIPADSLVTGAWAGVAATLCGHWLSLAIIAGGAITGIAMFNALTLSYARLPLAMAENRLLPSAFARLNRRGVPWVSVLVLAAAWSIALNFSFDRLIELDVTLYGLSLILELAALVSLRRSAPEMPRPFRIPGGAVAVSLTALAPTALILYAIYAARNERIGSHHALALGSAIVLAGPIVYLFARAFRREKPRPLPTPSHPL
jgi:amino acid transporter